jgi:chromosomal replication initiator protein
MEDLWEKALDTIHEQVSRKVFDAWIRPLQPVGPLREGCLELLVTNEFTADRVRTRYGALLESCLSSEAGERVRLVFRVQPGVSDQDPVPEESIMPPEVVVAAPVAEVAEVEPEKRADERTLSFLDRRYTFESFVVGGCNQFAHAVAERVAERPAGSYNPLFIYGGVGLGKTHIMHAIGNRIVANNPGMRVVYISSEKFMTQLINSLRDRQGLRFKEQFRSVDVLLVDDIQFIAGKKATQEEFFHTFNALYEDNKQIILTADSLPKDIQDLEERLRSRFSMGMTADMQPPELETRVAILKKKAAMEGLDLLDDVAYFLADAVHTNVRELEGAMIRVAAFASLTRQPITLGLVRETLRDLIRTQDRPLTAGDIQKAVAAFYNIRLEDMLSGRRTRQFSHPRQVAMFLCKQLTKLSYPEIGQEFGGRDHTTILYAVSSIEKKRQETPELAGEIEQLVAVCGQAVRRS